MIDIVRRIPLLKSGNFFRNGDVSRTTDCQTDRWKFTTDLSVSRPQLSQRQRTHCSKCTDTSTLLAEML